MQVCIGVWAPTCSATTATGKLRTSKPSLRGGTTTGDWESSAYFRDTGVSAGLVMSWDPAQACKELDEVSEVFPLDDGDGSEDEGAAYAEEDGRRDAPKARWGVHSK